MTKFAFIFFAVNALRLLFCFGAAIPISIWQWVGLAASAALVKVYWYDAGQRAKKVDEIYGGKVGAQKKGRPVYHDL